MDEEELLQQYHGNNPFSFGSRREVKRFVNIDDGELKIENSDKNEVDSDGIIEDLNREFDEEMDIQDDLEHFFTSTKNAPRSLLDEFEICPLRGSESEKNESSMRRAAGQHAKVECGGLSGLQNGTSVCGIRITVRVVGGISSLMKSMQIMNPNIPDC